jgi:hypothetical protein
LYNKIALPDLMSKSGQLESLLDLESSNDSENPSRYNGLCVEQK